MQQIHAFPAVLVFAACISLNCIRATNDHDQMLKAWSEFKAEYGKEYQTIEEEDKRLSIFNANWAAIVAHNMANDLGQNTFRMDVNELADRTLDEMNAERGVHDMGPGPLGGDGGGGEHNLPSPLVSTARDSLDYRDIGCVAPVKDQARCGSCWAFSAIGSLEAQTCLRARREISPQAPLVRLSEQQLIDCDKSNAGCKGGWMERAFKYIQSAGGVDTEESYQYKAVNETCNYDPDNVGARCTGYVTLRKCK